ncbi:hypothetical protein [Streptomyces spirodelae]|uniref:Uncharacterized protein n=1 Tax=Streptomyces spirodelae TaxID=2812904 RepID=A0ABS3WQY8_9ACTN|nr:hypothetical protein [Streptomyces spirodelae]MBO8185533.1 hypothetical protein [Streptomyces spirodelae]
MTTRTYTEGPEWQRVAAVNPELLCVEVTEQFFHGGFGSGGEGTQSAGSDYIYTVTVTLALAPFLQSVIGTLGSKAGDALTTKIPERLVKVLRRRREETAPTVGDRRFRYTLQVEDTQVKVSLPVDDSEVIKAVALLPEVTFDHFGDQPAGVSWDTHRETWQAWVQEGSGKQLWFWCTETRQWVRPRQM